MRFVNLTPHDVNIMPRGVGGRVIRLAPGAPARVVTASRMVGYVGDVPVVEYDIQGIDGIPPPRDGVVYIVSAIVRDALYRLGQSRADVVSPDQRRAVRDMNRRIIGITRLVRG